MKKQKQPLKETYERMFGMLTEGGDGILEPIQKAKSQRDAINYVKKFLKDEKSYGGDFGNIKNIKFVGNRQCSMSSAYIDELKIE